MNVLIVTVAGCATRFNAGMKTPVLKCLFPAEKPEQSMLCRLLEQTREIDRVVIVGGYLYEDLQAAFNGPLGRENARVELVYNPRFAEYGSMYSLMLGVCAAKKYAPDSVMFAEGDLIVDDASMQKVLHTDGDVMTVNREPIYADRSVVAYVDSGDRLHYLYDIGHQSLSFPCPIQAVFSSAQIWKFASPGQLFRLNDHLTETEQQGTNLVLIEKYFTGCKYSEINCITMENWTNCNTPADYFTAMTPFGG